MTMKQKGNKINTYTEAPTEATAEATAITIQIETSPFYLREETLIIGFLHAILAHDEWDVMAQIDSHLILIPKEEAKSLHLERLINQKVVLAKCGELRVGVCSI